VFAQALRIVIPPTGNQFISLLKASSLVSVIAGGDLLSQVENIYATNYKTIELLIVAAIWYITLTSITYVGQHFLEVRANRSTKKLESQNHRVLTIKDLGEIDVSSR
jgi:polar amino acid transport system permease protein